MIKLTARQIKFQDELNRDRDSYERTLRIAMNFHANMNSELNKRVGEFWDELAEIHDLDLFNKSYKLDSVDGCICIIEDVERDMEG